MSLGKIIIVNGTSSSGKTSIVKALQELLDEPYLEAGIDKFIWMLPERYLDRPLWDQVLGLAVEAGPVGHRLLSGMHHAIAALSRTGNNVIADHVLVEPEWVRECASLWADLPAFFVGVRCPLEVLEQRERARPDRTLGQAKAQFNIVHAHGAYDLEVDTSLYSPEECAAQIKARVEGGSPHAFRRLKRQLGQHFGQADIEEGLRKLGLGRGDAVEVHSALGSLGWVEGGAAAVVDALMNVVGQDGAIVMSAYRVSPPLPLTEKEQALGIRAKVCFLSEDTDERTGMGAIADEFRARPTTVLGSGEHRVCAWGRQADLHSKGYEYLLSIDGWALLLGVDIHRCSSMHIAESRVGIPAEIARYCQVPEDIRRDYPDDLYYLDYGGAPDDAWRKVQDEAKRKGLIKRCRIGNAECMLFKARTVVQIYEDWLREDPFGLFGVKSE